MTEFGIIRELWQGGYVNYRGEHFDVESASLGSGSCRCATTPTGMPSSREHMRFRWFGGRWKVNSELPGPSAFDAAAQFVRPEDVAESIPCGSDVGAVLDAVKPFLEAGFTHLVLVQIGGEHQQGSCSGPSASCCPRCASWVEGVVPAQLGKSYGDQIRQCRRMTWQPVKPASTTSATTSSRCNTTR